MKKVVLINQSTGYLMIDIVNAYRDKYDKVALIAGSVKVSERELDDAVAIDKIIAYDRSSSIKRFLTWVIGTIQIFFKLLLKYRGYEVVYVTNPPMSYLLSTIINRPFSVIVYDIYPDALKNIGIKEKNIFYKFWVKHNKKCLKKAKCVFTLSEGMGKQLEQYVEHSKIKIIPNWPASEKFKKVPKDKNPFIKEHGLEGKFIVLYSGNIGYTHNVEYLIEVANVLKHENDISFLIIGEGKKKKYLEDKVKEYGLSNCMFMTWQAPEVLPYSLGAADIGVITLNDETAKVSVPSKTYNLLSAGTPLLCITPESSELEILVRQYVNGKCFDKKDVRNMAEYVTQMRNDVEMQKKMSDNSLMASKNFTKSNAKEYVI